MSIYRRKRSVRVLSMLTAILFLSTITFGSALAAEYDLDNGSVVISAGDAGQTVEQSGSSYIDDVPVVTQTSASTQNTISVSSSGSATANVTISDVHIEAPKDSAGITVDGSAEITLTGDNSVAGGANHAGVEVNAGDSVVIGGDGTLQATAGKTTGSTGTGAGIGGANGKDGGTITITDSVTVDAAGNGAPINSDKGGSSAMSSAGIGGGSNGAGGDVTISGDATVTATGGGTGVNGLNGSYSSGGAGIGAGGGGADGGSVVISDNASVTAQGGYNAAGIGGAGNAAVASSGATVDISTSGSVTATGGDYGAGIGGGVRGNGGSVTVAGTGSVTATGGKSAAGIGGGGGGYYGGATVNGKRNISGGNGGSVTLLSGNLFATGGAGAAGIGGGSGSDHAFTASGSLRKHKLAAGGNGATVLVVDGHLTVLGGAGAVGIGSGSDAIWSKNDVMDASGSASFSASATASAGTLSIGGGIGSVTAGATGFSAVSGGVQSTIWLTDENGYDVTAEDGAALTGLYAWTPVITPVDPVTPAGPVDPTEPVVPAGPVDPATPVNPANPDDPTGSAPALIDPMRASNTETIPTVATPLAGPAQQWALINLLCAIATALLSAWMLIGLLGKREADGEKRKRHTALRLASIVVFAGSVIAFLLTENMANPMQAIDKYTPLMLALLAVQFALVLLSAKKTTAKAEA